MTFIKNHPDIATLAGFGIIAASLYFNFKDRVPSFLGGLTSPTAGAPDKATAKEEATAMKEPAAVAPVIPTEAGPVPVKKAMWGAGWREGRYGRDIDVPLKDLEYSGDVNQYKRLIVA